MTNLDQSLQELFGDLSVAEKRLLPPLAGIQQAGLETASRSREPVRSKIISWLLSEPLCRLAYQRYGFYVRNAEIAEPLQLEDLEVDFIVAFETCEFREQVNVERAKLRELRFLKKTKLHKGLRGTCMHIENDFIVDDVECISETLAFDDARIGGSLYIAQSTLAALSKSVPASIQKAMMPPVNDAVPASDVALSMARTKIGGICVVVSAKIMGQMNMRSCYIGSDLFLSKTSISNSGQCALDIEGGTISGFCHLSPQFKAEGRVSLRGSQIASGLNAQGAILSAPQVICTDDGEAELLCFDVSHARIEGDCLLDDDFKCAGSVTFFSTRIEGDFRCSGGSFKGSPTALTASQAKIKGTFLLAASDFHGSVNFSMGQCAALHVLKSDGTQRKNADLNLKYARCQILRDEKESWTNFSKYDLEGFQYESFWGDWRKDVNWVNWVKLSQGEKEEEKEKVAPKAYEQLARVLRAAGHSNASKEVLITQQKEKRYSCTRRDFLPRIGHALYGLLCRSMR